MMRIKVTSNYGICPKSTKGKEINGNSDYCQNLCEHRESEKRISLGAGESFECSHPNGEAKEELELTPFPETPSQKTINLCELGNCPCECEHLSNLINFHICEAPCKCDYKQKYNLIKVEDQSGK